MAITAIVIDKEIQEALHSVTETAATEKGVVVLRITIRGTKSRPVIEITLDGSRLVTVEDCQFVSGAATTFLDEAKGMSREYRLDVLSPGVDEPLMYHYQFQRSIGRLVEVTLKENLEKVTGYLDGVTEDTISIERTKKKQKGVPSEEESVVNVALSEIAKASVLVDFNPRPAK